MVLSSFAFSEKYWLIFSWLILYWVGTKISRGFKLNELARWYTICSYKSTCNFGKSPSTSANFDDLLFSPLFPGPFTGNSFNDTRSVRSFTYWSILESILALRPLMIIYGSFDWATSFDRGSDAAAAAASVPVFTPFWSESEPSTSTLSDDCNGGNGGNGGINEFPFIGLFVIPGGETFTFELGWIDGFTSCVGGGIGGNGGTVANDIFYSIFYVLLWLW